MSDWAAFLTNFKDALGPENFNDDALEKSTKFRNFSFWDSISIIATIIMFDAKYGKLLTAAELSQGETLGDLFNLATGK